MSLDTALIPRSDGLTDAQRNMISLALMTGSQLPAGFDASPYSPYQYPVDPADPADYSLADIVAGFPTTPSPHPDPPDTIEVAPAPPTTLEAPTPQQQQQELDVLGPPEVNIAYDLEAPDPAAQMQQAMNDHITAQLNNQLNNPIDDAFNTLNDSAAAHGEQGAAIAADVAGSLSAMNAAVNDAVAGYATDTTGSGYDAGGSAIAADVGGLSGLNAGVNDAAAGYDSSGGFSGDGASGGGGGGGGGK